MLDRPSAAGWPQYLYKFRSLAATSRAFTRRIVTHSELYFASPLALNDPFEGYFAFDKAELQALEPARRDVVSNDMESLRLKVRDDFLRGYGIVSLSARYDSSLMWAHYADSHKGICFEFDMSVGADWGIAIVPVTYADACLIGKFTEPESIPSIMVASLYHKSADWSYEQEWRFIGSDGPGPRQFPLGMLSGVIFGSQVDVDAGQEIYDLLRSHGSLVRIGKAARDPFSYNTRVVCVGDSRRGLFGPNDCVPWHLADRDRI